jgi:hypothetical protein
MMMATWRGGAGPAFPTPEPEPAAGRVDDVEASAMVITAIAADGACHRPAGGLDGPAGPGNA